MADPGYRALLIGNSTFPLDSENLQSLRGPVNDIAVLRDALTDPAAGLFEAQNVTLLPERTAPEILIELERFFGGATRHDTLLLYYSGHGLLNESGGLFLCARDTRTNLLRSTAVGAAAINMMFDDSAAQTTIIVLDCCHSGAFKGGDLPASLEGSGRYILSSCRSGQLANDAHIANGTSMFTQHLTDGLIGEVPDSNQDGYVDLGELYDYVFELLSEAGRQLPQRSFAGDGRVVIARRQPAPAVAPDAPAVAQAVAPAAPAVRTEVPTARPETPAPARPEPASGRRRRRWWPVAAAVGAALAVALVVILLTNQSDSVSAGPADLKEPDGIAVDRSGQLYVADTGHGRVKRVGTDGLVASVAELSAPGPLELDGDGNLYVVPMYGEEIGRLAPDGSISSVRPTTGRDLFTSANKNGMALRADGTVYVATDTRVLAIAPDGAVTPFAGTGNPGFRGDGGPATSAEIGRASDVALDGAGDLYIADYENNRVRKVGADGNIVTVVGGGSTSFSGDGGPAVGAGLDGPAGLAFGPGGEMFISEWNANRIRRVSPDRQTITTVAGDPDKTAGFSGDGGPARSALLKQPKALALDNAGNLFVGDHGNNRVRRMAPDGTLTTVA